MLADESEDDWEGCSGDESDNDVQHTADAAESMASTDDDDDILYQLADNSDASGERDGSSDTEVNSNNDECKWSKQPFVSVAHNFHSVKITPRMPFLSSDTPVDFFTKFLTAMCLTKLLVNQTNMYANQNQVRHWADTSVCEIKAFVALLIGMVIHNLPHVELYSVHTYIHT